jgi:hypothetical protein
MNALKARVVNGRITLDAPTDLPDGQVVELVPVDDVLATEGDDLEPAERAALHQALDASIADADAGRTEDLAQIVAQLRAL